MNIASNKENRNMNTGECFKRDRKEEKNVI
ncbi:hypothetical protein Bandiella_00339 [Candidatus Bandiella woodruffii]|uniref:Uncharacterized protein n=1 Tax=Candidatus Bandiella euplotis TaxID=1664265 RepID=A0ABZ0UQE0_9RICK|nr:hypothetical protein Bandiella_00339 [Candidatus Bandiella woodruffii]